MWLHSIVGISVVFLALIALSLFIYLFGIVMKKSDERVQDRINEKANKPDSGLEIITEIEDYSEDDSEDEIVAVITAAIRAALANNGLTPECKIKVKSFKRVSSQSPAWHEAGIKELVN